jgi:hypothetical protein
VLSGLRVLLIADVQKPVPCRREIGNGEVAVMAWIEDLSRLGGSSDGV